MTPDLQSCLLCDDVRQERNGKFILIGLFDAIGVPAFPLVYPRLFMVTRWCSGEGGFLQHTRILAPDQEAAVVEGKDIAFQLPGPEATATNVEIFMNKTFTTEGTHWVEILLNGDLKLRFPLRVQRIVPPPGTAHPPPA
jgi:hypothetical protein